MNKVKVRFIFSNRISKVIKVKNDLRHKDKESDDSTIDVASLLSNKINLDNPINEINIKKFIYEISKFSDKRVVILIINTGILGIITIVNLMSILRYFLAFFTWLVTVFVLLTFMFSRLLIRIIIYFYIIVSDSIFFFFSTPLLLLFLVIV